MKTIKIGDRRVGDGYPALMVAELSANHLQSYGTAVKTVRAMKRSGADAVKLQTYTPDTITINSESDLFKIKHGTLWNGKALYQLYKTAYTPWEWQPKLKKIAEDVGLICFSSPFDKTAVDFLENMDVPAYKVASLEITDIPLIEYIASKKKPVMISTGIATLREIDDAVKACKRKGNSQIALLKCASEYPSSPKNANLKTIPDLAKKFKVICGLSDHTLASSVPVAAVALGAKIIEKHFILDKRLGGPDAAFSLDPQEFAIMARAVREAELAMGEVTYKLSNEAKESRIFSRSLFAVKDIGQGQKFSDENIRSIRPGHGLPPNCISKIIGKNAKKDIKKGTPLDWSLIRK